MLTWLLLSAPVDAATHREGPWYFRVDAVLPAGDVVGIGYSTNCTNRGSLIDSARSSDNNLVVTAHGGRKSKAYQFDTTQIRGDQLTLVFVPSGTDRLEFWLKCNRADGSDDETLIFNVDL